MKHIVFFFVLLSAENVVLTSCSKTASFHGKIINAADAKAINDASVRLACAKAKKGGGAEVLDNAYQQSDENGQFGIEADATNAEFCEILVTKEGYISSNKPFYKKLNRTHEVNFELTPIDSWLDITIQNDSGEEKMFFHKYLNPLVESNNICIQPDCPTIVLQSGGSRKDLIFIPGGTEVTVKLFPPQAGFPPPFLTRTVFCDHADTSVLVIKL